MYKIFCATISPILLLIKGYRYNLKGPFGRKGKIPEKYIFSVSYYFTKKTGYWKGGSSCSSHHLSPKPVVIDALTGIVALKW
jgi:hypothetical protein